MEGHEWVSLGGVGHVELSEGFFLLTHMPNYRQEVGGSIPPYPIINL